MFHLTKAHTAAISGLTVVAALCAAFGTAASAPAPAPAAPASVVASTAVASLSQPECRASSPAGDAKLQALRQSCELELEAFEACRASRPEWDSVELFSCGFEMSTSLARGDVEDPASLEDCGTTASLEAAPPEGKGRGNKECPVPACEAELEALEAEPAC